MALKLKYLDPYGVTHPEAYFRIIAVNHSYPNGGAGVVGIAGELYSSEQAKIDSRKPLWAGSWVISGNDYNTFFVDSIYGVKTANPRKQAYAFLRQYTPRSSEVDLRSSKDA